MGRYEVIRAKIDSLNGGQFQALAQHYVTAKYGYQHPHYLGTKAGTEETTRGIPDAFWPIEDNKFVFVECGHYMADKSTAMRKIRDDIDSCREYEAKSKGVVVAGKILICHGYGRFNAKDIAELVQVDDRVELIGPDQIAEGLYRDYPGLAKDYLDISFDSNQIMEPDAFIRQNASDYFAPSLIGPLIGRDKDMELLLEYIEGSRAVVVLGKSGCGKTKIAYEACSMYAKRSGGMFYVIRSRHRSIYEDLRTYLEPGRDYIVLVDDANSLNDIDDLVDFVLDRVNVKLVMTVRNYVAESVCKSAGRLPDFKRFELAQLHYEEMMQVAEGLLDERGASVAARVVENSHGNLRLMYLAAQSVNEQGVSSIRNMKHLLDLCYDKKLDLLSDNERKAACISSILGPHRTEDNAELKSLEKLARLNHSDYKAACLSLCEKELLDSMHGVAAVSFEEQNIRDYLIYDAICVSRWLTLGDIDSLSQCSYRLRYVLNILTDVFGDEETIAEAKRQLCVIWDDADSVRRWGFAREFGPLFGHRALTVAVERIRELPKADFSWREDCFKQQPNTIMYEHGEFGVLESFFGTDFHDMAVDTLLSAVESGFVSATDARHCFYELAGAMKMRGNAFGVAEAAASAARFREWCADDSDRIYCFLSFTQGVLDDRQFYVVRSFGARNANVRDVVISGDATLRLRRICIEALCNWQGIGEIHRPCSDLILGYRPGWVGTPARAISVETMSLIVEEFVPSFHLENVGDYEKLLQFEYTARRCGLVVDFVDGRLCHGRASEILVSMLRCDFDFDHRDQAVKELGASLRVDEYVDLFGLFRQLNFDVLDSWWVSYSTKQMMTALREGNPARFGQVCLSYLESGVCPDVAGSVVADYAVAEFGAIGARNWFLAHAVDSHPIWLHFSNVAAILAGAAGEVAEFVLAELDQVNRPIHFDDIYECEMKYKGFLPKYYEKLFEGDGREGYFLDSSLPAVSSESEQFLRNLAERAECVLALEGACIKCLKRAPDRPDGALITWLVETDSSFAARFARTATVVNAKEAMHVVGKALQGVDPQSEKFDEMVLAIYESESDFAFHNRHESLLGFINGAMNDSNRGAIIEWMAEAAVMEGDFGAFVRAVARALDEDAKRLFVIEACRKGIGMQEFDAACCGMSFQGESWSGSYIPLIQRRIAFLEGLEKELLASQFGMYRLEIADLRGRLEQQIYAVEEDEFVRK